MKIIDKTSEYVRVFEFKTGENSKSLFSDSRKKICMKVEK